MLEHARSVVDHRVDARDLLKQGTKIAAIVATMGTTDHFGLDDLKSISPRAHTYMIDAVPWAHVNPADKRFWKTPAEGGPLP